ncbi:MAG: FliG C-terminal domain-containing protein [Planctomycetota bacterium]
MTTLTDSFTQHSTALRKVAILIGSVDQPIAETLLEQLSPETQAAICRLASDLTDIDPHEREQVVADFLAGVESDEEAGEESAAVEVDDSLTRHLARQEDSAASEGLSAVKSYLPWRDLPARSIGQTLGAEHPQVVAVILAHLPPTQAAEVLGTLPAEMQTDVLRRIARAPQAAPELLREIVDLIETRLPWLDATGNAPEQGVAAARAILEAASEPQRATWTSELRGNDMVDADAPAAEPAGSSWDEDPELPVTPAVADQHAVDTSLTQPSPSVPQPSFIAKRPPLGFAELLTWNDQQLAKLLVTAEPLVVLLALASAPADIARKFQSRLAPREARELARQLTRLGPWRLADAALATEKLLQLAAEMQAIDDQPAGSSVPKIDPLAASSSLPGQAANHSSPGSSPETTRRGARWRVF